ncbi:tRNA adenosine(34) deaminase TadA [Candidatus Palibaumannia cicadellinicola]|uniref:tRNA-specific adenosine deaminase n=1 Tax=Candidatus Palibaumannia cicadellinicola TaxID=186490 RepID=A0A0K2BJX7_9GAMM|nr:tRNA adenosine(34) deaminase TadA [Candidatus Baumannia cicadellinicola]AKZ65630.1 tRNA-specific adenosine-34 deaminase [Candidatus Baumannia cicadellinicola]
MSLYYQNKKNDQLWMRCALSLAKCAETKGEVPVGAVLVLEGQKIGEGYNSSISSKDPTAHAEIIALRLGGKKIGNYRINGAVMYVTLEPCVMCTGAMVHARINRIVFGAKEGKTILSGASSYVLNYPNINHSIILCSGVLENACTSQVQAFFHRKRASKIKY